MRYFMQIAAMLTELILVVASIYLLFTEPLLGLAFLALIIIQSQELGGPFYSWRPSIIKKFLTNAKKIGL